MSTRDRRSNSFVYGSPASVQTLSRKHAYQLSVSSNGHVEHDLDRSQTLPKMSRYEVMAAPIAASRYYGHTSAVAIQSPSTNPSWIPPVYMALLDHFLVKMTRSLSYHDGIQKDLCSLILPMALETSHLLAAVLLVSASHRVSRSRALPCSD